MKKIKLHFFCLLLSNILLSNSSDLYEKINQKIEIENKKIKNQIIEAQKEKKAINNSIKIFEKKLQSKEKKSEEEIRIIHQELSKLNDKLLENYKRISALKKSQKTKMNTIKELGEIFQQIGKHISKGYEIIKEDISESILKSGSKITKKIIGEKNYQKYFEEKPFIIPGSLKNLNEIIKEKKINYTNLKKEIFNIFNTAINDNFSNFFIKNDNNIITYSQHFKDILAFFTKSKNQKAIKKITNLIKNKLIELKKLETLHPIEKKIIPVPKKDEHKFFSFFIKNKDNTNKTKTLLIKDKKRKTNIYFPFKNLNIKNNINVIFELNSKTVFLIHDKNQIKIINPQNKYLVKKAILPKVGSIERIYIINDFDIAFVSKNKKNKYPLIYIYRYLLNKTLKTIGLVKEENKAYKLYEYNYYLNNLDLQQLINYTYLKYQSSTVHISKVNNEQLFNAFDSLPKKLKEELYNLKKIKFDWARNVTWKLFNLL